MARIGITCQVDEDGGFGLFSNNVRQTAFFLQRMFKENGHAAILLSGPDSVAPIQKLESLGIDGADVSAVAQDLDHVIVVSRVLSGTELDLYRSQGAKIIRYIGGSLALDTMAAVVGGRHQGEAYADRDHYDAIWMPNSYAMTYKSWCEVVYQVPVYVVPPLWYPMFVPKDFDFHGVQPNPEDDSYSWNIGIVEAGNTMTHTAHFPLMACSFAREGMRTATHKIGVISIINADELKDNTHFKVFMARMGFGPDFKTPKVQLLSPMVRTMFIKHQCDMIVTHDIEDSFDYTIFEALFGGYPVIHCSDYIGLGYRYNRYDPAGAGLQIRKAMESHDPGTTAHSFRAMLPLLQDYTKFEVLL